MATQHIDHLAISVLDNFYCEVPEILVTPYLKIVQVDAISDERADTLWQQFNQQFVVQRTVVRFLRNADGHFSPENVAEMPLYALVWDYSNDLPEPIKEHYDTLFTARRWMDATLTALRILGKGTVRRYPSQNIVNGFPELEAFIQGPLIFNSGTGYIAVSADELATFPVDCVSDLASLAQIIHDLNSIPLKVATSRLDSQHSREDVFDRILDTAIALESLYVPGNVSEIKYRMGMRVAAFLGGMSPSIREEMYELVQVIYEARSDIAHGNRSNIKELEEKVLKSTKWKTADELLVAMTTLLCQSLKKVLLEVGERKFMASPGFHKALDLAGIRAEAFQLPL